MYILFSDGEHWHIELGSKSIRRAITEAKDRFQIKGRLRRVRESGNSYDYKLDSSDYGFTLTLVQ